MKGNGSFRSLMVVLALLLLVQIPVVGAMGDLQVAGEPPVMRCE